MEKLTKISKIEKDILKIADQFANKNKRLNIRKLQSAARSQFNYSNVEISQAIYNLILNKLIFPEKKLTISNVLSNKKREDILNYINENPGSHLRELRENLNLNPKVANWHLKVLENFNMIYRKKYLKYRTFFPSNFNKGSEEPLLALKNENSLLIFKKIFNLPDLDLGKLKDIVDLDPKVIKYHLERLISSGIIKKEKNFYKIVEKKVESIQKYLKVELKEEIEPLIPVKPPIPIKTTTITKPTSPTREIEDLLNVKREYDYVGGGIRFKIAVQNVSKTVITDINVTLVPTSQYEIPDRVKVVDILKPGESRGVDFDLIPLTCGKSKVFGSVSFIDPFGNPHTATVTPKEIQIKCPLVQPKILTQIELLKSQLQKGSAKIPFKIDDNLAFNIIIDQISALDLSEINVDKEQYLALYSGIAKVTADNMIIESTIKNHDAILTVWTKDLKQATGFLAYLKNLIQMAFETASKLAGKTEKISQKILDSTEIILRFFTLFDYCDEGNWNIGDILLLMKEIKTKLDRSLPGLSIIDTLQEWINDLDKNYRTGDNLSVKNRINLEFDLLKWFSEVNRIACQNLETYQQTFPEQETQIQQLCTLVDEKNPVFDGLKKRYTKIVIQYLMIIDKSSGLTLHEYNFTESKIDPDLLGGFLTAIQSFGSELSQTETSMTKLAYKNFEIALDDAENIRAALILKGQPIDSIIKKLNVYINEFESKFKKELKTWSGNVALFKSASELVKKIFE